MNRILQKCVDLARHPVASFTGVITGLSALGALAATLQNTCAQLSHIRGVPPSLVAHLQDVGVFLASLGGAAVIIAATGESILKDVQIPPPEGPSPPPPLPLSGVLPPTSLNGVQQKAA